MVRNQSIKLTNSGFKASMNDLPIPIIHHILSFLPDDDAHQSVTKQVTRLNLVSKWWQHACSSYPVLGFSERCYYNEIPNHLEKIQQFIGFVDKTMNRYRDNNNEIMSSRIEKLKLRIDFDIYWNERYIGDELCLLLDKWINIGLEKEVPYVDLRIRVRYILCDDRADRYEFRYHMPHRVVSSNTIKSLLLGWQVCLPRNWEDHPRHLSSSLHSLELHQLQHLDKNAFQTLIRACTTIQKLTVDTELEEINIWGLNHLKMATIRRRYVNDISNNFKLMINAPSLETLCLSELGYGSDTFENYYPSSIHLDCCVLKCLKLTRDCGLDDDQFHQLISRLPSLESLQLEDCCLINNINIANPLLKKLELKFGYLWKNIRSVRISSPNVVYFRCKMSKRFPSIYWMSDFPNQVEAVFEDTVHPIHLYCYWFCKLRESMLRLKSDNNHVSMSLNYIWHKESLEGKKLVPTHLPACKIDNLNLNITAHSSSSYAVILSRLFSTFHPTTLRMSFIDNDNGRCRNFLQFVCENLANRRKVSRCLDCFGLFKCWKHQLVNVQIQDTKGPREDGATMMEQLSSLTVNHHVCFKLQWAT